MGTWSVGGPSSGADIFTGDNTPETADALGGDDELYGNGGADTLYGGNGGDLLDGGAGADTMYGGAGDDDFYVDNANDVVVELSNPNVAGYDHVFTSISYVMDDNVEYVTLTGMGAINVLGNSLSNTITGNDAANAFVGGAGADTFIGKDGDDVYFINSGGDYYIEDPSDGIDTVKSTANHGLYANVENLILVGTGDIYGVGNELNNRIEGNSGFNALNGLEGADTMIGGDGSDSYFVDNAGDIVTEVSAMGGAFDQVLSSIDYVLPAYVERLQLSGAAIIGTGNADANRIVGNNMANVLDGGGGADVLNGGDGNDLYVFDSAADRAEEGANSGYDKVRSSANAALDPYIEALELTGTADISGTGNLLANAILGNDGENALSGGGGRDQMNGRAGDDTLDGGDGRDDLVGGAGADVFVFSSALAPVNVDRILDFNVADDTIHLSGGVFTALAAGPLAAQAFYVGVAAHDLDDRIIYNPASGQLYYDADGSGVGAAIEFAILPVALAPTEADFFVI